MGVEVSKGPNVGIADGGDGDVPVGFAVDKGGCNVMGV